MEVSVLSSSFNADRPKEEREIPCQSMSSDLGTIKALLEHPFSDLFQAGAER